jgi:choline dehydrogenase
VTINSSNPFDPPQINPNLLASKFDIFTYRESVKASQRFFAAPAWKDYVIGPFQPPANATSDQDLDTYLRENAIASSHASGTCAMSAKDAKYGVVDPDLRVKGVKGLRVVDASIMVWFTPALMHPCTEYPQPFIPAGHTQVPVYVIAEKASQMIKSDWQSVQ